MDLRGAEQWAALQRELKQMADKGLEKELNKAATEAVAPFRPAIRASARANLPSRGGFAEKVARSKINTRKSRKGVTVVMSSPYSLRKIDQGKLRHRVFGQNVWVVQDIPPGFHSEVVKDLEAHARVKMQAAMDDVARKLRR